MAVTDTDEDLEKKQTDDGTDDSGDADDDDVKDRTGDGSDDDASDDGDTGDDAGAGEDEDDDPPLSLPYTMDGEERTFDYRIVQGEDGKIDLDEDTKSRFAGVLPTQAFQSKFDRSQADLQGAEGRVEAAETARRAAEQRHADLKSQVEPFTHHLSVLRQQGAREHFVKMFAKQLAAEGYDPSTGFDPHAGREEQIAHRERKVTWETETKPFVDEIQRKALKAVHPDISEEEIGKVMSYVGQHSSSLQPQLIPDPGLGYPPSAFAEGGDVNAEMRRLAEVPITARKIMIADGLIESAQLKDLKEANKNLSDKFDRAASKAKAKATGGGAAASKGGKKKQKKEMPRDPGEFAERWIKENPDKMKD